MFGVKCLYERVVKINFDCSCKCRVYSYIVDYIGLRLFFFGIE